MKQAVILAGGKGTRLKERLNGLPKPLIDVGGTPLLEHQILLCRQYGFTHITVLVNHAAEAITEFCKSRDDWGLSINCVDDGKPRGTAGAVLAVLPSLADSFLVLYGDTMLSVDLDRFWEFHQQGKARSLAGTLFLHPNDHPQDSDIVVMKDNCEISAFRPYPHAKGVYEPNLVNAALYILNKAALEQWVQQPTPLDFGKDLFPRMAASGQTLLGYNSPEYIKDCGTPERLDKITTDYVSGRIARARLDHPQRAVFLDRDGTINQYRNYIARPEDFELVPGIGAAIRRLNQAEYRTALVTNQPVIARGECSVEGLRQIHNKMETLLGESGAYLDRLYYCPHHPDKGFPGEIAELKINCACRKPNTGMVEKAKKDLNVDLSESWLIGDSTADMQLGMRTCVKTILVETGEGGRDGKYSCSPDFVMPDAPAAINFIVDDYPKLRAWAEEFAEMPAAGSVILIGGAARSGKTTLASALNLAMKKRGYPIVNIAIDRWLFSAENRTKTVMGRYDIAALRAVVERIAGRKGDVTLNLPRYDKMNRKCTPNAEEIRIPSEATVIIEGTIALSLTHLVPIEKRVALNVVLDESLRHQRFMQEYRGRGNTESEAEALYASRMSDEVPYLNDLGKVASLTLKLPLKRGPD